jgi:hypothetical protein
MTEQAPASSVQHLGFAWFAMVMGLCGLSLTTLRCLMRGQLLQPEGPAPLPQAGADPAPSVARV